MKNKHTKYNLCDIIFNVTDSITINANDLFCHASDAVVIDGLLIYILFDTVEKYGTNGLVSFLSWHEDCKPLRGLPNNHKEIVEYIETRFNRLPEGIREKGNRNG